MLAGAGPSDRAGPNDKELRDLLQLLPRVHTVVLVGNKAPKAEPVIHQLDLCVFKSAHPGPLVKGSNRALWDRISQQWAEAALASTENNRQASHRWVPADVEPASMALALYPPFAQYCKSDHRSADRARFRKRMTLLHSGR
jgi:hypothetical protein